MSLYAKPGLEGPQCILEWDLPSTPFHEMVLVRREKRFPENLTDGTHIVATSSGTKWADINNLEGGKFYYYSLFAVLSGTESTNSQDQAYSAALNTNYFKNWFYENLPQDWRVYDQILSEENGGTSYLLQQQSGTYGEYFNLGEDGTKPYYSLQKLLRLIGIQYDRSYSLSKLFHVTQNINLTPLDFIRDYGDLVGARIFLDPNVAVQRHQVRSAIPLHALKGTYNGVRQFASELFEGNAVVLDEQFDNIVYLTNLDSGFINLSEYHKYFGLLNPSGTDDYFCQFRKDRLVSPDRFVLSFDFSQIEALEGLPSVVFSRLFTYLKDYIPINSTFIVDLKGNYHVENASEFPVSSDVTDVYGS